MINKKHIAKKILREFTSMDNDTEVNPIPNQPESEIFPEEPTSFSRSGVGRDLRDKIFGMKNTNMKLLQFIDDFNDLLINNPKEMTRLSQQLQNKLPQTIQMLQQLDPETRSSIMNTFIPKLKMEFFSLYSMVLSVFNSNNVDDETEPITQEVEPVVTDIEPIQGDGMRSNDTDDYPDQYPG